LFLQTFVASIFHWIVAYLLVDKFEYRMTGVAVASSLQFVVRFLVSAIGVRYDKELQKAVIPFSDKASWVDLKDMMKLGLSAILFRVMGWWAFDVSTTMAACLPMADLAGQTILRNISLFTFMIPVGL
jgi:Na+-driven multidrug efflux pump